MTDPGPAKKWPSAIYTPTGSEGIANYGRSPWRSTTGIGILALAAVFIAISVISYADSPDEMLYPLIGIALGILLAALVLLFSWLMRPRLPSQKD